MVSYKKCCFCFPLRRGLLCIGYLRLVTCLVTTAQFTLISIGMMHRAQDSYEDAVSFLKSVAPIIPQLLDLIFTLTFIVAAHKKNHKLFEVYYLYCITLVLLYTLATTLVVVDWRRLDMLYHMVFQYTWIIDTGYWELVGLGTAAVVLQIYMTLLVRSETYILKEKKKAKLVKLRCTTSFRLPKLTRMDTNTSMK